ncbi:MAG: hypothetical protein J7L66_04830 [Anaerolineaceae bacterium]|nr:hypothetical protein [Anaerolineaceae bacterium]
MKTASVSEWKCLHSSQNFPSATLAILIKLNVKLNKHMRITRDQLIATAKETVKRATFGNNDIVCAYLTGSLTFKDPLIGGTTDIDLIYVHSLNIPAKREIVPIADNFHLDIAHFSQSYFSRPRNLRSDAWVGSFLCDYPILLHDSNHWYDFVRSSAFSHFFQPANIIQRVRPFITSARQSWINLKNKVSDNHNAAVFEYLKAIKNTANALTCITSVPLTDRRFLIDFPRSAQAINMPGLVGGLVDLIVPADPIEPDWDVWLGNWSTAFLSIQQLENTPLSFTYCRLPYYKKAILGLKEENNHPALWLMLWTWAQMAVHLQPHNSSQRGYEDFLSQLMLDKSHFSERLSSLDQFLDVAEEFIDGWQQSFGI